MEFRLLLGVVIVGLGETLVINHEPKYFPEVYQNHPHPGVRSDDNIRTFRTYWPYPPLININSTAVSKHSASTASKFGIPCHNCMSISDNDNGNCVDTDWAQTAFGNSENFGNTYKAGFKFSYHPNKCLLMKLQHDTSNGPRTLIARRGILVEERSPLSKDGCVTKYDPIELTICTCSTSWCNGQRTIKADPVIVFIIVLIISSKHFFPITAQAP